MYKALSVVCLVVGLLVGCNSTTSPPPERLGTSRLALLNLGQPCNNANQCTSGFCVDTVCCDTACGNGARDALSCSNTYGVVPGLVEGTCKQLVPTDPCGDLEGLNPCTWRGSNINGGGNCPAPGSGLPNACYVCDVTPDCPPGLPICINNGCTFCNGNFGSGGPSACPTSGFPFCIDGGCFECTPEMPGNCTGDRGSCDPATNACTGCDGDFGAPTTPFECAAVKPVCLPSGGCVECTAAKPDACVGAKPFCDTATNTCVGCLDSSQCPAATPVCSGTGACVACAGDRNSGTAPECPSADFPACVAGACLECSATDSTACKGATPVCNTLTNKCVQCLDPTACPGGLPFCNNNTCTTGCTLDAQCMAPTPLCAPSGACVACLTNAECSGNTPICVAGTCTACNGDLNSNATAACTTAALPACSMTGVSSGRCVACTATNATACTGATPVCDVPTNTCVQCTSNTQCTGPNGICNTTTKTCTTGCTSDANCTNAAMPACKLPEQICVECTATNKTLCVGAKPICDLTANQCVACTKSSECPGETPICNPQTKTCTAECSASAQCPGDRPVCDPVTKRCVDCVSNTDCMPPTPICNTTTHMCGTECTKNSECPGSVPICNPQTKNCVECVDDTMCTAERPRCDGSTNKCVEAPAVEASSVEGGGCSCSTIPSKESSRGIPALLGLGLVVTAFARRRRNAA